MVRPSPNGVPALLIEGNPHTLPAPDLTQVVCSHYYGPNVNKPEKCKNQPVVVDVYYESGVASGFQPFLVNTLMPLYKALGSGVVELNLKPWGNAQRLKNVFIFSKILSIFLMFSICIFAFLSHYLFISLSHCLIISLSHCLIISLSHYLIISLSLCLFVSLSLCLFVV